MATIAQWDSGALPAVGGTNPPTVSGEAFTMPGPGGGYASWDFTGTPQASVRFYITTPASWASTAADILRLQYASGIGGRVALAGTGSPGAIRLCNATGTTIIASPNNTATVSTLHRIEIQYDSTADTVRGRVFAGDSLTPLWDSGLVSGDLTGAFTQLRLGKQAENNLPAFSMSHVLATNALEWLGPATPPDPGYPKVGIWDGAAFVEADSYGVWDGAALMPGTGLTIA